MKKTIEELELEIEAEQERLAPLKKAAEEAYQAYLLANRTYECAREHEFDLRGERRKLQNQKILCGTR